MGVQVIPEQLMTRADKGMIRGNRQIFNIRSMMIDRIKFSPMAGDHNTAKWPIF